MRTAGKRRPAKNGDGEDCDDKRPTRRPRITVAATAATAPAETNADNKSAKSSAVIVADQQPATEKSVVGILHRLAGAGASDCGQLADGGGPEWPRVRRLSSKTPTPETAAIIAIAAGAMHNLVLTADGRLVSFGCDDDGATGRISTTATDTATDPVGIVSNFWSFGSRLAIRPVITSIACGDAHSAVVDSLGRVWSFGVFGDARTGRIGFPADDEYVSTASEPRLIIGGGCGAGWTGRMRATAVACGEGHTVVLVEPGLLVEFGVPTDPAIQLRRPSVDEENGKKIDDESWKRLKPRLMSIKLPTDTDDNEQHLIDAVWSGGRSTFARLVGSGRLIARGVNNYGQLGIGRLSTYENWSVVDTITTGRIRKIAAADHHTIMLAEKPNEDSKTVVLTSGRGTYGRLGNGGPTDGKTWTAADDRCVFGPIKIAGNNIIDVSAGPCSSHLVGADGRGWSFGSGPSGQLGIGNDVEDAWIPTEIKLPTGVGAVSVAAGAQHTVFLLSS